MATIPQTRIEGRRFGLLADTHDNLVEWPDILERIRTALGAVDGIIHCGDLSTRRALEDLSKLAPVWAVRSSADPVESPPDLVDGPRILQVGGVRIGVVNSLSADPIKADVNPACVFLTSKAPKSPRPFSAARWTCASSADLIEPQSQRAAAPSSSIRGVRLSPRKKH